MTNYLPEGIFHFRDSGRLPPTFLIGCDGQICFWFG